MQRTKPKIISVGNSNRARSFNNLVGEMKLVVSWKKLDYEEVWNINESLGSCVLQRSRCRERDPKSANRTSVCIKIYFRNRRRKCSQKVSRKLNLNIDTSQTAMQSLIFSDYLFSVGRNETPNRRFQTFLSIELSVWTGNNVMLKLRLKNINNLKQNIGREKQKVCFSKNELKSWFWRKTRMETTKHISFYWEEPVRWAYFGKIG